MNISWGLIAPLIILQVILLLSALVSLIKEEETNGPKWMWVLIIAGISIIGPVLFFSFGRKR